MRVLGPGQLPKNEGDAIIYQNQALEESQNALLEIQASFFTVCNAAPARPRETDIRFADGTNWDPGSGRGLYQYVSGAWVKL